MGSQDYSGRIRQWRGPVTFSLFSRSRCWLSAARAAAAATTSERPSYANFEIVRIDPDLDAEEAARTLAAGPDVEYAQAAYRVHTQFTPNDEFYSKQWNLPDIDLERAWDIQPAA